MKARTLDGRDVEIDEALVTALRSRHRGAVILPGEGGYHESRSLWNAMNDRHPALVARCIGAADVLECVRFARDNHLLLCVKGGGHNIAGLAVADGAFLIDLSSMRGVWVDAANRIARARAVVCSATWTARRRSTALPRFSASFPRPASPG